MIIVCGNAFASTTVNGGGAVCSTGWDDPQHYFLFLYEFFYSFFFYFESNIIE